MLPGDAAVCWCSGRATRPYLTNRTYRENAGALTPIKATVSKRRNGPLAIEPPNLRHRGVDTHVICQPHRAGRRPRRSAGALSPGPGRRITQPSRSLPHLGRSTGRFRIPYFALTAVIYLRKAGRHGGTPLITRTEEARGSNPLTSLALMTSGNGGHLGSSSPEYRYTADGERLTLRGLRHNRGGRPRNLAVGGLPSLLSVGSSGLSLPAVPDERVGSCSSRILPGAGWWPGSTHSPQPLRGSRRGRFDNAARR